MIQAHRSLFVSFYAISNNVFFIDKSSWGRWWRGSWKRSNRVYTGHSVRQQETLLVGWNWFWDIQHFTFAESSLVSCSFSISDGTPTLGQNPWHTKGLLHHRRSLGARSERGWGRFKHGIKGLGRCKRVRLLGLELPSWTIYNATRPLRIRFGSLKSHQSYVHRRFKPQDYYEPLLLWHWKRAPESSHCENFILNNTYAEGHVSIKRGWSKADRPDPRRWRRKKTRT